MPSLVPAHQATPPAFRLQLSLGTSPPKEAEDRSSGTGGWRLYLSLEGNERVNSPRGHWASLVSSPQRL